MASPRPAREYKRAQKMHPYGVLSALAAVTARGRDVDELKTELAHPLVEVNWQDEMFGNTALHWAVANSSIRMAFELIERAGDRIDYGIIDHEGKTVLHLAIGKGYEHYTDCPRSSKGELAQAPLIQKLILIMSGKHLLDAQDNLGNTPLHIAVLRRDTQAVEYLIEKGANPNIKNNPEKNSPGKTPLELLEEYGNYQAAEIFLKRYARVFTLSNEGWETRRQAIIDKLKAASLAYAPPDETNEEKSPRPEVKNSSSASSEVILPPAEIAPLSIVVSPPSGAAQPATPSSLVSPDEASRPVSEPAPPAPPSSPQAGEVKEIKFIAPPDIKYDQAILYIDSLVCPQTIDAQITPKISRQAENFQNALRRLKEESKQLSAEDQDQLAGFTLEFSKIVASRIVEKRDIENFYCDTMPFRKNSKLGLTIGVLIGAAIGIGVGVGLGMLAGLDAATAFYYGGKAAVIASAMLGGLTGFFAAKTIHQETQPLGRMDRAAEKIVKKLNKPKT